jgi:hypothetical protein
VSSELNELALRERCDNSRRRSSRRRELAARTRKRKLRLRGSGISVVAVVLAVGVVGAGAAVGQQVRGGGGAGAALLVEGSQGPAVAAAQRALGIPADGQFGARTEANVKVFQRRRGLVVDGVVGPQTRAALGLGGTAATTRPTARSQGTASGTAQASAPNAALQRIANCESGGNPRAVSANGQSRGKYQFTRETWAGVGGSGDPAAASEAEQDRRAAMLYARSGPSQWPNC